MIIIIIIMIILLISGHRNDNVDNQIESLDNYLNRSGMGIISFTR